MDAVLPDLPRPAGLLRPGRRRCRCSARLPARARRARAPRGAAVQRARQPRPGSSTSCWPSGRACCWSPPTTSRSRRAGRHRGTGERRSARSTCGWTTSWSTSPTRRAGRSAPRSSTSPRPARCVLANAPGNGVADDKAMYCYVPELIAYYLQERPLLESVPTYRTSDETERRIVLERVGELVTKPVDGHGGHGRADRTGRLGLGQVAARRAEIAANPDALGRPGGRGPVLAPDLRRRAARAPARRPAGLRLPAGHRAGTVPAGPPGPDPRRPGGQPGGQLLPGRRRQGHLDHRSEPTTPSVARSQTRREERGRAHVRTRR